MVPRADLEIRMRCRLVPKHAILQPIRLAAVVDHQTLVIFGALVHNLTEELKRWENTGKLLKNAAAGAHLVFAQNKHVIDLTAQHGRDTHHILNRKDVEKTVVTTVHEKGAHVLVADPLVVVQAVVHHNECAAVHGRGATQFLLFANLLSDRVLPFQHVANNCGIELLVDKNTGHHGGIESVGAFCAADHSSNREFLFVPH